jgi:adenylate kinase family enzyme
MVQIIISGLARSGKDTAAKYIAKKYKLKSYTFSSVITEHIEANKEKPTKKRMIEIGDKLRKEKGMDIIAKILDEKIKEKDNLILVGPRSIEEIEFFKKKFPKIVHVKITSEKSARFNRKSKIDPQTPKEFFERDKQDIHNKGFKKVLDSAEYEIINNSTKKNLYTQLDVLMKTISEREK